MWLHGSGARDVIPTGAITTGKQLASDGAGTLYWGDREGSRVSRVRIDTGLMDLVVNTPDDTKLQECVGVAVDPARGYLYWTQKGPAIGGKGRIFRAGLEIPAGQTAANRTDIEVLWNSLPEPVDLEIKGEWLYLDRPRRPTDWQHAEPRASPRCRGQWSPAGDPRWRVSRRHRLGLGRRGRRRVRRRPGWANPRGSDL